MPTNIITFFQLEEKKIHILLHSTCILYTDRTMNEINKID